MKMIIKTVLPIFFGCLTLSFELAAQNGHQYRFRVSHPTTGADRYYLNNNVSSDFGRREILILKDHSKQAVTTPSVNITEYNFESFPTHFFPLSVNLKEPRDSSPFL